MPVAALEKSAVRKLADASPNRNVFPIRIAPVVSNAATASVCPTRRTVLQIPVRALPDAARTVIARFGMTAETAEPSCAVKRGSYVFRQLDLAPRHSVVPCIGAPARQQPVNIVVRAVLTGCRFEW